MPKLDYYNITHKGLSYSRQLVLDACPRKYEMDAKFAIKANRSSVTFSYGHAVAAGIQFALAGHSYDRCIVETLCAYTHDVDDIGNTGEQSGKKSIWHAIEGVHLFCKQYQSGTFNYLDGWEIAKFIHPKTGEVLDAIELTFVVELLEGYSFEGHIDLILYHPKKKRFMVIELKTTGMTTIHPAQYQNSSQALGYGAVLDMIASSSGKLDTVGDTVADTASFDVLYLVFQSRTKNLVPMPFTKTAKDRVDWLNSLMLSMEKIEMYEKAGYPKHGQSCYDFFRPCEYLETCSMTAESINKMYAKPTGDSQEETYSKMSEPTFMFTLEELMDRQDQLIESIISGKVSENSDAELLIASVLPD